MRLACPAHRSARPDCDLVAGGGSGWLNANGCRGDPTSPRRANLVVPVERGYVTPEIFFVDWMRGSVLGSGRFPYARLFHWATKPFSWPNDARNRHRTPHHGVHESQKRLQAKQTLSQIAHTPTERVVAGSILAALGG